MAADRREFRRWMVSITFVGLAVRVAWLVTRWHHSIGFEDAFFYHYQANLLADGHGFIEPVQWLFVHRATPAAEHPPLYSLYLAMFSFLGATSVGWHLLASTALGAATVPMIGLVGREMRNARVGVIAAVIAALYPNLWYQNGIVWAETMAQALVVLFLLVAYRYIRRPNPRTLGCLGLCCALAAMARVELVLLLPFVVIPLALLTRPAPSRRRMAWAGIGIGMTLIGLLPWSAFNLGRFEDTTTLSSNFGLTMASANCDTSYYGSRIGYWSFWCAESRGTRASLEGGDQSQVDTAARREATSYIADHLGRVPAVAAARIGRISGLWRPLQQTTFDIVEGRPRPVAFAGLTTYWLVAGLAVAGTVRLRHLRVPTFPALGPPAVVLVAVLTAFASTRYRASCEPALVVLAAVGVEATLAALGARSQRPHPAGDHPSVGGQDPEADQGTVVDGAEVTAG